MRFAHFFENSPICEFVPAVAHGKPKHTNPPENSSGHIRIRREGSGALYLGYCAAAKDCIGDGSRNLQLSFTSGVEQGNFELSWVVGPRAASQIMAVAGVMYTVWKWL